MFIILYLSERTIEQRSSRKERSDRIISEPIPYDLSQRGARPSMAEPAGSAVAGTHFVQEDSLAKIGAAVAKLRDSDHFLRPITTNGRIIMLDILGAITGTAIYAAVVGTLIGLAPVRRATRLTLLAAAIAWAVLISAVAALGGLAPGTMGPVPAILLPFASVLVALFGSWFAFPRFRTALLSMPLEALIGLNAARLAGFFFLLLAAAGRLSAPFAPMAAWGDMITGAAALPLAAIAGRGVAEHAGWRVAFDLWNLFGAVDLIVAVSLGVLSAQGTPFRVFTEGPGTLAMTTLPWAFIPAMIVPLFLLIHFTIAMKLRALPRPAHNLLGSDLRNATR